MTWDTVSEPAPPHHWIEEGTPDDFLRNVMESDITPIVYSLMGTVTGRIGSNDFWVPMQGRVNLDRVPLEGVPLMGTYCNAGFDPAAMIQLEHYVHADMALVEQQVMAVLLARPEMAAH